MSALYTRPMHPEVQADKPGSCPKCGMVLEPMTVSEDDDTSELDDMTRRFWVDAQHPAEPVFCVCLQHGGHSYCGWCPVSGVRLAVEPDDSRGGYEPEFRVGHWQCTASA